MTTSEFMAATFGVSMDAARNFIIARISEPQEIYQVAVQYGVTSTMLGEITGYPAGDVEAFFTAHGFNGAALAAPAPAPAPTTKFLGLAASVFPEAALALDYETGILSVSSLRSEIAATLGSSASLFDSIFQPSRYLGYEDGTFTPDELGSAALGSLPATSEALQSAFFGTMIQAMRNIDFAEAEAINQYGEDNAAAVMNGDPQVLATAVAMLMSAISSPTPAPVAADEEIAWVITHSMAASVQLVASQPELTPFYAVQGFI